LTLTEDPFSTIRLSPWRKYKTHLGKVSRQQSHVHINENVSLTVSLQYNNETDMRRVLIYANHPEGVLKHPERELYFAAAITLVATIRYTYNYTILRLGYTYFLVLKKS